MMTTRKEICGHCTLFAGNADYIELCEYHSHLLRTWPKMLRQLKVERRMAAKDGKYFTEERLTKLIAEAEGGAIEADMVAKGFKVKAPNE